MVKFRLKNKDKTHILTVKGSKPKKVAEAVPDNSPGPDETQAEIELADPRVALAVKLAPAKDWKTLYNEGRKLGHQGEYAEAIVRYKMAENSHPGTIDIPNHIGVALFHLKQYNEAEEVFMELHGKFPDDLSILDNLVAVVNVKAEIFEERQDCESAMIMYKELGRLLVDRQDVMEDIIDELKNQ